MNHKQLMFYEIMKVLENVVKWGCGGKKKEKEDFLLVCVCLSNVGRYCSSKNYYYYIRRETFRDNIFYLGVC